ncbi:MAG: hypothetical protein K6T63_07930 [Alicyclobacillus herbarius]|uniref:hypothetical protein n=1 Tax=Alicyclobacillus herbarius TaxID=122960 RepID=UPI002354A5C9|nr:hypothetical protein [Alicyclobacillus herbarius]MCL6632552.1 hypothetical protein [Alicyclobacillus herbarius]
MPAWVAVLRKDLRMTRNNDLVSLIGIAVVESLMLYLAYRTHNGAATMLSLFLLVLHLFFLPVYVYMSLAREWRKTSPLWLHLPLPGWALLASKFTSGLIQMLISFCVTGIGTAWIVAVDKPGLGALMRISDVQILYFDLQMGCLLTAAVFALGIYMTVWAALVSLVMQATRHQLGRWRWLVGIGIVGLGTWGVAALNSSKFYHWLSDWGLWRFTISLPDRLQSTGHVPHTLVLFHLYAGDLVFSVVLLALVYAACSWLLDRKVEV